MKYLTRARIARGLAIIMWFVAILLVGCSLSIAPNTAPAKTNGVTFDGVKVAIVRLSDCGCCEGHSVYLSEHGFLVETTYTEDLASVKERYQIPQNMQSCHTAFIEGYFIEGHIPVEAIEKLLAEKPDIDGIALPGMPLGSPGMSGQQTEAFIIYALADGKSSEFMTIDEQ